MEIFSAKTTLTTKILITEANSTTKHWKISPVLFNLDYGKTIRLFRFKTAKHTKLRVFVNRKTGSR